MAITLQNVPDLVNTTLQKLNKDQVANTQALHNYPGMEYFFAPGTAKEEVGGGTFYEKRVRLRPSTQSAMVGFWNASPLNRQSYSAVMNGPWTHLVDKSVVYDREEMLANRDEEKIVDEITMLKDAAYEGVWNLGEAQVFGRPTDSSDNVSIKGLGFLAGHVATGTTDYVGGFNGTTSRYTTGTTTTVEGIDRSLTANRNWRNFCANHDSTFGVNTQETLRNALKRVKFKRIKNLKQDTNRSGKYVIFVPTAFFLEYERIRNTGPDYTGGDVAHFNEDEPPFRGVPLIDAPQLNSDTDLPIFGCYTKHTYGIVRKGAALEFSEPIRASAEMHNVFCHTLDMTCQLICDNPREGLFVIHAPI